MVESLAKTSVKSPDDEYFSYFYAIFEYVYIPEGAEAYYT